MYLKLWKNKLVFSLCTFLSRVMKRTISNLIIPSFVSTDESFRAPSRRKVAGIADCTSERNLKKNEFHTTFFKRILTFPSKLLPHSRHICNHVDTM